MKIAVAGIGYVGLSNAILLSLNNEVVAYDINQASVDAINARRPTVVDNIAAEYLATKDLRLSATTLFSDALKDTDFLVIATPTDYDPVTNFFDTSSVEHVIKEAISVNPKVTIVIKSTVPVGFTERMIEHHQYQQILFSPEFLREGLALYDNLHPSRIIVGGDTENSALFAELLAHASLKPDVPVLLASPSEAEAIKLFSNTFLAMRVAYFNELDSYAQVHGLNSKKIIEGVGLDSRIGTHYRNPSLVTGAIACPKTQSNCSPTMPMFLIT